MNPTWSLDDLYRTILGQWRTLLLVGVISIAFALAVNFVYPERFEADAILTVEPIEALQSDGGTSPVNMETERVVATSTEVLAVAVDSLNRSTVKQLQDAVEVSVPRDSQVLSFTFSAETPVDAANGANAIATAYNSQRVMNAQRVVSEAVGNLTDRIDQLDAQLDSLPVGSSNGRNLELQIGALQERLAILSSATFASGSLVSPAVAPADSTKPSIAVFLAAGLFLGVLLGTFAALIRGRTRGGPRRTTQRMAEGETDFQSEKSSASAAQYSEEATPTPSRVLDEPDSISAGQRRETNEGVDEIRPNSIRVMASSTSDTFSPEYIDSIAPRKLWAVRKPPAKNF